MKRIQKAKELVRIRQKTLANGNDSIYLDIYNNGKRNYEFLKLYLIPERNSSDKAKNKETLQLAEAIKAKIIVDIQNETFGFKPTSKLSKLSVIDYITEVAELNFARTGKKQGNYYNFASLNYHLINFKNEKITFADIDDKFIKDFIDYLRNSKSGNKDKKGFAPILSPNTQHKLFVKLKQIIEKAERDGIIASNPILKIEKSDKPKTQESKREYLTISEIKELIATPCKQDQIKKSFLFCCLTGLRYGDVSKIKWGDFQKDSKGATELRFKQQKTNGIMYLQISNEAIKWLPKREDAKDSDLVYKLPKNDHSNKVLSKWVYDANISKKITFHCSRHTAATLNLTLGVPIEVVSKLMGHTKISTTQIYAKIVNDAKREAVNKQNGAFE